MSGYRDDIGRLKAERNEVKYKEVSADLLHHDAQRMEAEQSAQEALARGDSDGARWLIENASYHEEQIANLSGELNRLDAEGAGQQQSELSDAKRAWIERRADLAAHPQAAAVANAAHDFIVNHMGVADDSESYFELMGHAVEPANYQPMPTPDDIAQACGIDAKTYNKGVERLEREKRAGNYPDR